MTRFNYVVVDVFTDRPLAGNQLAVFTDAREIPEERLQPLAREINFSENCCVSSHEQSLSRRDPRVARSDETVAPGQEE